MNYLEINEKQSFTFKFQSRMKITKKIIYLVTMSTLATKTEKSDLIAFLKSLTDREFLENPRFAKPLD